MAVVTYDQPVHYDHQGVTYDGVISLVNDGNSRPTATQARNSVPTTSQTTPSAPALGGGFSSRPEHT